MIDTSQPSQTASPIDASIIVCSYNRSASLQQTLLALQRLSVGEEIGWEVLIVDNNSTDDTRTVAEDFCRRFPRARYCYEPNQGLSFARNRGVVQAQGEILLFTDDDVCPEPEWLQHILDGMAREGCDACGGYIAPVWEVPPPAWLTERFYGFLALRTSRHDTFPVTDSVDFPFGANMAFRRSVFEAHGAFDVTRGRKGSALSSGEDGELFDRLLRRGVKIMFFGDARVHHRIEAFRVTKRYFRRWRFQTSRNLAESRGMPGARRVAGIPLYIFPQLMRACTNAIRARFTRPADEAFQSEMIVWHFLGLMRGLLQKRKGIDGPDARMAAQRDGD
jgi:glucosyl-dolichyl phosphate glucuronosyltransferase